MHFPKVPFKLGLYPVVDSVLWIERLLNVGVRTLQLRIKHSTIDEKRDAVRHAIALAKKFDARLFINDEWQLAIEYQAYGVHLGQEDLLEADLSAIAKAGLRLGVSTHSDVEIERVLPIKPSYIALGPVFATQTKEMAMPPQGITKIAEHVAKLSTIPTVAIGGISIKRAEDVLQTGVGSIAVVSAITQATDWRSAVTAFQQLITKQR
ncbi:thiamine phosphate synthase [Rosenbergiella sp. S61]|uniref:Thiamine-phosphate synthase n=1 Tax=Rosenbergiella gaditana TaxID=2726987 RepID=A0ABS5T1U1_9GAMM|nr:thiamine phosphate synthase [Rosenbergiella gaditana]MBT0725490.1 thiamine phosphate synthase [Rosenbergiella gaditana]